MTERRNLAARRSNLDDGESSAAESNAPCPHCEVISVKPDRKLRRLLARQGRPIPERVHVHADGCPDSAMPAFSHQWRTTARGAARVDAAAYHVARGSGRDE